MDHTVFSFVSYSCVGVGGTVRKRGERIQGAPTGFYIGNGTIINVGERCRTKKSKISLKQHITYFHFRSKIQLNHPVRCIGW